MTSSSTSSHRCPLVVSAILSLLIALGGGLVSVLALAGHGFTLNTLWLFPLAGLHLRMDTLSAFFDLVTSIIAFPVALYMYTYFSRHRATGLTLALMPVFIGAMLLLPMAATYFDFWFFWEAMALSSAALVLAHYRDGPARVAGFYYIAYTQVGFALILAATAYLNAKSSTGLLEGPGSHLLPVSNLVFILTFVGFSSKAGLLPLNSWLPLAHPEAPTPVSVLMSAAMVNLGIYGIVRIDLVSRGQSWWGLVMIVIGLTTATYGALHALISADIKRLLAFSTSENLGIIVTALGTYELLRTTHFAVLAELALAAAVFHTVGHALFKSLAFVSAGRLVDDSGSRSIDEMGEMIHRSPLASAGYGVASFGATGLPVGAGFIGEWLLLEALIHTPSSAPLLLRVIMPIAVALLALTVGLKVAAMTKAFGIGVLSRQRKPHEKAVRRRLSLWIDTGVILTLVLANGLFGVFPDLTDPLYQRVARVLMPRGVPAHIGLSIDLAPLKGVVSPIAVLLEIAMFSLVIGVLVQWRIRSKGRVSEANLWNCGGGVLRTQMQYNSTSFAQPLETIFANTLRLEERTDADHRDSEGLIVAAMSYERSRTEVVASILHRFTAGVIGACARLVRGAHPGNMRLYVLYGAVGLLIVLLIAR